MNVHSCQLFFFQYNLAMPYLKREAPNPEPIDCRILTAALDLFVDNGYHNVSVHDVQKRANVSIGSIYNHFGGKEGIAKALYKHLLNEVNEMIDSVIAQAEEQGDSVISQCNRIIELFFEYTESKTNIISFVLHSKHNEFIRNEIPICSAEPFKKMRAIVESGIKRGELKNCNSWVASTTIFGGAIRLIHLRLDGVIEQPLPELYEQVIASVWHGIAVGDAGTDINHRSV